MLTVTVYLIFSSFRENYLFTCKCSKCVEQAGEPDVTSEEEMDEDENEDIED